MAIKASQNIRGDQVPEVLGRPFVAPAGVETFRPVHLFMGLDRRAKMTLKLTQKVKARYPNIIVSVLTGHGLPEYRESSSENIFALVKSILPTEA